eukprot:scaffold162_cov176-Amphora_coffeaeformis.AAC.54
MGACVTWTCKGWLGVRPEPPVNMDGAMGDLAMLFPSKPPPRLPPAALLAKAPIPAVTALPPPVKYCNRCVT